MFTAQQARKLMPITETLYEDVKNSIERAAKANKNSVSILLDPEDKLDGILLALREGKFKAYADQDKDTNKPGILRIYW